METIKYGEQISFFDIELPPNNIEEVCKVETVKNQFNVDKTFNFAQVPDSEYQHQKNIENIPTVNELLKMLEKGLYRVNATEFLSDVYECGAIAVSNRFDLVKAPKREERYLQIIKKYEPDMQRLIADIFARIYIILSNQINPQVGFADYLGELYMRSETSNKHTGQFFTPFCISKVMAQVAIEESNINEYMQEDKILTMNEPTCGAGGMILAAADILYNKYHFNYSRNLLVECSDIDSRCVHMSYLQLGLAGIPAIIYKRNTLTMETWERWETPAYIMQYMRFRNVLKS